MAKEYFIISESKDGKLKNFTREELAKHKSGKSTFICARGLVFDVSSSEFYNNTSAPYNVFAGRDSSKALGLSSVEEKNCTDDISSLEEDDIAVLDDWVNLFASKYPLVGILCDSRALQMSLCDQIPGLVVIHLLYHSTTEKKKKKGTILCVHGFPDCGFSFRHNIQSLLDAGYDVIVPDQRGYALSSSPAQSSDYAMEKNIADNLAVLDFFGIRRPVLLGHDWGGTLVWNMASAYPDRVAAVIAVCTPFFPVAKADPWPKMLKEPGRFEYQVYFNEDKAVDEINANMQRFLSFFIRAATDADISALPVMRESIAARGGILRGLPDVIPRSSHLSEDELAVYVTAFSRRGFFGPLSWYRNVSKNYQFSLGFKVKNHISVPCLMISAERDFVLTPSMADNMHQYIPDLTRKTLSGGHFVHQESAVAFNTVVGEWLKTLPDRLAKSNNNSNNNDQKSKL